MIQLSRVRTNAAIPTSFRGATPRNRLVALMKEVRDKMISGDQTPLKIKPKWSVTKGQLLAETNQKCAYCESHTSAVAFGDVEHYRPKSVYWWLAYVYDNYLASCSVCNQRFKGKAFEFTGQAMQAPPITDQTTNDEIVELAKTFIPDPKKAPAVAAFEQAHRDESPLIPNPYVDAPEKIFAWEVLEGSEEVEVVPQPAFPNAAQIVDASERIYGLNRPQLTRRRFKQYRVYRLSLDTAAFPGLERDDFRLDRILHF